MYKKNFASRLFSIVVIVAMVFTIIPQSAMAASGEISVVEGTANVKNYEYQVTAEVSILDGKISKVKLSHNAMEAGEPDSVSYADVAKAMETSFVGKNISERSEIEGVDVVTGATITSDAYKSAVLNALGYEEEAVDLTFGSANKELMPGTYKVPVSLKNATAHDKPSNAAGAFPAMATLTINEDGTAVITSDIKPVTIGPITDMAYDIKYYLADSYMGDTKDVEIVDSMKKPDQMINAGKEVPTKVKFQIPNNHLDGIYMNFTVDAMGPASPDAWLQIDYASAKEPGETKHLKGSAKVNQFGKYTIYADVSVTDGTISDVSVTADDFISETHRPTNESKIDQVAKALKAEWNGIAPTQENAEKIFKKIMKKDSPENVIDSISGATYSGKAVRDAVMEACGLEYQDEVINVPKSIEPGIYEVDVEYASDVVWHSLLENAKGKATLTVNNDKTMSLEMDLKSGTEKEPLYILGFNGVYPNNDRTEKLTKDGCEVKMGLSSNDYEDENFAKGTEVVNYVKFPLKGGLNKVYNTNAYLYVPAMKKLNGELSGVNFENGKFNVDVFAKIFWDDIKKIGDVPEAKPETPAKPGVVQNVNVKTDNGLLKVTFNKVKNATNYKIWVQRVGANGGNGYRWYYGYSNGTMIKQIYKQPLVKNAKYQVKVQAINDGVAGNYSKVKTVYANRVGNKPATMFTPKFASVTFAKNKLKTTSAKVVANKVYVKNTPKNLKYKVSYKIKGAKTWKSNGYSASNVTTVKGLTKGKTYTFALRYRYLSSLDGKTYIYSKVVYRNARVK